MELGRKFSADALIYAWHAPPPPPAINESRPSVAEGAADARLAPTSSFPPLSQPPPPPSRYLISEVAVGVGLGFGAAVLLLIAGCLVLWSSRRKRRMLAALCEETLSEKSKDDEFDYRHQQWQQSCTSPPNNMVSRPPTPTSLNTPPSSKKHFSTSVPTSLQCSISSSSGSQKPFLSGFGLKHSKRIFTYEELALATDGFSDNNLVGEGGFGLVHKGILSNGIEVAVKQLKLGSGQGEREFQSEVDTISHIHHKNLVSLVGYCSTGDLRLLVYDYVPNKTLDYHLHGKRGKPLPSNWAPLNWATRMKVALGSAKGLAYLHEDCQPKIIHRDIKAANILLDNSFEAKVSDFGLARFNLDTDTHVSTRVIGTFGYIAPEYAQTGKLTIRSDVFSFGVMLLELITGRQPIANDKGLFCKEDNIVDWARPLLAQAIYDADFDTLVDARLHKNYDFTEMSRMVTCAAACVRHLARLRPRMSEIVQVLEGKVLLDVLKESESICGGSVASSDFKSIAYTEKFKKLLFDNLETSSECSGLNTDFTLQPSASSSELLRVEPLLESSEVDKIETNQNGVIRDGKKQ